MRAGRAAKLGNGPIDSQIPVSAIVFGKFCGDALLPAVNVSTRNVLQFDIDVKQQQQPSCM